MLPCPRDGRGPNVGPRPIDGPREPSRNGSVPRDGPREPRFGSSVRSDRFEEPRCGCAVPGDRSQPACRGSWVRGDRLQRACCRAPARSDRSEAARCGRTIPGFTPGRAERGPPSPPEGSQGGEERWRGHRLGARVSLHSRASSTSPGTAAARSRRRTFGRTATGTRALASKATSKALSPNAAYRGRPEPMSSRRRVTFPVP